MNDLISRGALKKHFAELVRFNRLPRETKELAVVDIEDLIDHQPTVDAAPVVRCKDCRYWGTCPITPNNQHMCERLHIGTFSEFYCSYAGAHMDAPARAEGESQ